MTPFIVLALLATSALAAPQGGVSVAQDTHGNYKLDLVAIDHTRQEQANSDGTLTGAYTFKDKSGNDHRVIYRSGKSGFIAEGDLIPVDPLPGHPKRPLEFTPEVAAARAEHSRIYNEELARAATAKPDPSEFIVKDRDAPYLPPPTSKFDTPVQGSEFVPHDTHDTTFIDKAPIVEARFLNTASGSSLGDLTHKDTFLTTGVRDSSFLPIAPKFDTPTLLHREPLVEARFLNTATGSHLLDTAPLLKTDTTLLHTGTHLFDANTQLAHDFLPTTTTTTNQQLRSGFVIGDTPEVAQAKADHFAAHKQVLDNLTGRRF